MKNLLTGLFLLINLGILAQETGQINLGFNSKAYDGFKNVHLLSNQISDYLTIEFEDYETCKIYLFNTEGRRIFKQRVENQIEVSYSISNLKPGIYLLFVVDKDRQKLTSFRITKI